MSEEKDMSKEGCPEEELEDDDMATINAVGDKVSIQKILEGMTNEFNRSIHNNSAAKSIEEQQQDDTSSKIGTDAEYLEEEDINNDNEDDNDLNNDIGQDKESESVDINSINAEDRQQVDEDRDRQEEEEEEEEQEQEQEVAAAEEKEEDDDEEEEEEEEEEEAEEEVAGLVEGLEDPEIIELPRAEIKKDNIPRIVLTFRTIDETTNDGRKTKISSCASNLSLVPDELGNCDQIGGVSVKIEHSDDHSDAAEKSDTEENNDGHDEEVKSDCNDKDQEQPAEVINEDNNLVNAVVENVAADPETEVDTQETVEKPAEVEAVVDEIADPGETVSSEPAAVVDEEKKDQEEGSSVTASDNQAPLTRKRRSRTRLRAFSDSTEETPSLKRSARRLCKESGKSTVLESAMAIKEKSYSTEENKKRKYTKPGRPRRTNVKEIKESKVVNSHSDYNNYSDNSFNDSKVSSPGDSTANDASLLEDPQNSSVEYEGMPKLSPMVKDSPAKTETVDDSSASDVDKPFLKPAGRRKDRGRPRNNSYVRKIIKNDSFEDGSPVAEAGKNNDYPEEYHVPMKRTRRTMVPSPSPAEGQASKPESSAVFSETYEQSMICLCQVRSQLYVTITGSGTPLFCTAIDSIDNRLIGCCNEVDGNDVAMRRPSTRVPFIILCRAHKERLLRHNCCPSCGLFCTQGKFVQCMNGHQFHRDCEVYVNKKPVCPHCANETSNFDALITMTGSRKPVYIPTRRKFSKLPSAKMSLPGKGDNTKLAERPPSPLVKPEDIKMPEVTVNANERPERFTIVSLYTSVKNGDLDKLVNVLACGYNANHSFREYSHRTALHIAAERGHLGCVHALVQAGAQLDVMDKNQLTPLMLAAMEGKTEIVRYLVRVGADVTLKGEDGMTALHMAAKSGHIESCRIILSECKVPRTLVDSVDDGGWTSLIWACEFCHTDVARFLLEKKCDPLIRDAEQNIALHWSAYSGSSDITEMLLNEGCDVSAVNVHGDTPLHIAARQDQYAVSVLLLARGAKVSEINAAGETAINCCTTDGDTMAALRLNAKVIELSDNMWEKTTRILTNDVSRGKESNPIQCVNGFDSEDKPTDFLYVVENCFTSNINVDRTITSLQSCHCEDNCSSEKCLCGNISLRCWYDEDGKLIPEFNYADPPMLFECNQACACNRITCNNRVVQHGLTQRFQLFRTKGKGWGLRTLRHIPKGTYVCEYVGEIISDSEADHREDDSYLFDLDNRDGETYCIDARRYGNLARFINHSCAPNLLPVRVFVEHQDLHFPRIAFFANRNIEAHEELGFDYGEKFWIIKYKSFTCTCGALSCRYSEKTIQVTLDNYRKKIQQEEILAGQLN